VPGGTGSGDRPLDDSRIKHLQMIQDVIARLAAHSFAIKGVAVTASSALIGLGAAMKHPGIVAVAFFPVAASWGLDAFYLRRERMFRAMFDAERVRAGDPTFDMRPDSFADGVPGYLATARSCSLSGLYLPMLLAIAIVFVIWWFGGPR
jgi:hypothetical protein